MEINICWGDNPGISTLISHAWDEEKNYFKIPLGVLKKIRTLDEKVHYKHINQIIKKYHYQMDLSKMVFALKLCWDFNTIFSKKKTSNLKTYNFNFKDSNLQLLSWFSKFYFYFNFIQPNSYSVS